MLNIQIPVLRLLLRANLQAVLAAPCDEETGCSKELSVALANRSAVLFSLKAFHLALDDIRLALESGQVILVKLQGFDHSFRRG